MSEHDVTFRCMGCDMRIVAGPPAATGAPDPGEAVERAIKRLGALDALLTRFDPDSELSRLNADPREVVPASALLCRAVASALAAAVRTDGLVDPTLLGPIERAGYVRTLSHATPPPLSEALSAVVERRAARPHPAQDWRRVSVDPVAGTIRRPPGVGLDLGGSAKGFAADLVAEELSGLSRFVVDVAGDLRVGGVHATDAPYEVHVAGPFGGLLHTVRLGDGGVATSGIGARLWRTADGGFAHHLLDPATGAPAWTGVAMATALAPTTAEAEMRAKWALLAGPRAAREALTAHGGLVVLDNGEVVLLGSLRPRPVVRFVGGRVVAA